MNVLEGGMSLWVIGSGMEIINGFSLITLTSGTIPLISYIAAIPMSSNGIAASILSIAGTVYAMVQLGISWYSFMVSQNAGALLGLCLGTFFSVMATANAFKMSFTKFAGFFAKVLLIGGLVESALAILPFVEIPWDISSIIFNFIYLPIEFFLMMGSSVVAGIAMKSLTKTTNIGSKVIKGSMKALMLFQALVSLASLLSWASMTQALYLYSDKY